MTPALAALLISIAGAALVIAIGTYFWINRKPSEDERFDRYGRVPLFGISLTTNTPNGTPIVSQDSDAAVDERHGAAPGNASPNDLVTTPSPTRPSKTPPSQPTEPRQGGDGWGDRPGWPVQPSVVDSNLQPEPEPPPPPFARPMPPMPPPRTSGNGVGSGATAGPNGNSGNMGASNGAAGANGLGAAYPGNSVFSEGVPGSMVEGHGVRFSVPAEGTLQFLPGRLEISTGVDAGREIRFVRVPGPNGTEVTFGRNEGPLYRHVQLRDHTVSREHARMSLVEGQWSLANLSRTNPVALNGRILGLGEQLTLQDGDRVEMGEVVFSFRSR